MEAPLVPAAIVLDIIDVSQSFGAANYKFVSKIQALLVLIAAVLTMIAVFQSSGAAAAILLNL